jgi:hypothetical protein
MATNTILNASTTDGDKTAYRSGGGSGTVQYFGTFDGASLKLQIALDGATYTDISNTTKTAADVFVIENIPTGAAIRVVQASSGASTSLSVIIAGAVSLSA